MAEKKYDMRQRKIGDQAQAIVEFAIVLPILLLIVVGIFEVGRYLFIYSAVTNASRNAVRYASAVGLNDDGYTKYNYCEGIKKTAQDAAFLISLTDVDIFYDDGSGNPLADNECDVWNATLALAGQKQCQPPDDGGRHATHQRG